MIIPLTLQTYPGELPPFTGVAVNVTGVPIQTGFWFTTTETDGTMVEVTAIVTWFERTGLGAAQVSSDVSSHTTVLPLDGTKV
jgi:hypothetical protein